MFNWMSQSLQGRPQALPGSLVVLDTSFTEVHRDAWDCSLIQQIVFPAMEVASGNVPRFNLALQITNLREVPLEAAAASAASPAVVKFARLPRLRQIADPGHRKDPLPFFGFKVVVDGFPANLGVRRLGSLTVNLGPNVAGAPKQTGSGTSLELVLTMAENSAADFRSWKQSGGKRNITIQCLSTALQNLYTFQYKDATITRIHPAAPLSVTGDTQVTVNVSRCDIQFVTDS